jgi:(p)ppGpp synthase/HD superfamily hydrolase
MNKDYLKLAEELAKEYHNGQKRLDGSEYISHLKGVVDLIKEDKKGIKIVAWLQDILEDTSMTKEKLLELGFDKGLVNSIVSITRQDENYLDYILRCSNDEIAKEVKIADLTNNLSNLKRGSLRDKYLLAHYILTNTR